MVTLDVAHLPYNRPLLDYLRDEHAAGRKLYLATGADRVLARNIAAHLGIFEDVMASDGSGEPDRKTTSCSIWSRGLPPMASTTSATPCLICRSCKGPSRRWSPILPSG